MPLPWVARPPGISAYVANALSYESLTEFTSSPSRISEEDDAVAEKAAQERSPLTVRAPIGWSAAEGRLISASELEYQIYRVG